MNLAVEPMSISGSDISHMSKRQHRWTFCLWVHFSNAKWYYWPSASLYKPISFITI